MRGDVRLRLEAKAKDKDKDGWAGREYRVNGGRVEVRSLQSGRHFSGHGGSWHRLSSQQLSIHVERNTVVARWLERRLGWRPLLQACVGYEVHERSTATDRVDTHAA